eukprot:3790403-Amphidinium_carterae.3
MGTPPRCVSKYLDVHAKVGTELQNTQQQMQPVEGVRGCIWCTVSATMRSTFATVFAHHATSACASRNRCSPKWPAKYHP